MVKQSAPVISTVSGLYFGLYFGLYISLFVDGIKPMAKSSFSSSGATVDVS